MVFSLQKKRNLGDNLRDREANVLVWLKLHSCAGMSVLQPVDQWSLCVEDAAGVRGAILWHKGVENGAIQPPFYVIMPLSFFLCYHLSILLQNMDILNYNLPLLSYWSWLCLRFGSFPNTISVFTCSSQRGNYMWKHSIRRWYFVAIIHKPCVYMGFLRRIQSISPYCDASTSISNDCSKSLCFLQK